MVFRNIFDFAKSTSDSAHNAQQYIQGHIPTQPAEDFTVAPHDPFEPVSVPVRNPKIVRETQPQAGAVWDFVNALTGNVKASAEKQDTATSDPSTTVNAATGIMVQGEQSGQMGYKKLPKPELFPSDPPTVTPPKPFKPQK